MYIPRGNSVKGTGFSIIGCSVVTMISILQPPLQTNALIKTPLSVFFLSRKSNVLQRGIYFPPLTPALLLAANYSALIKRRRAQE
jgi:hypothetical protein